MRTALYLRVSTEEQARHGYSLAAQRDACERRAAEMGASTCVTYADEGVSGSLLHRPGLDRLREDARRGELELAVIWEPDRLSRNLAHQLLLTEELERARVRLEFVNFEWRSTPEGQLFYAMRGAIAQYEREKIRERTGRGRLQKARQGRLPLAVRPYGYDYDPDNATLVPIADEAARVQMIYHWLLEEGIGPGEIARRLNHLGIPAKKGGGWHRAVVRSILVNPLYTGLFHANRWDTAGCSLNRHRPQEERIAARLRPQAEWIPIAVPSLLTPQRWQAAQQLLTSARRLWAGKPRSQFALSGLLVCGRCGEPMNGFTGSDWGVRHRKYTCRRRGSPLACGRSLRAGPLERAIWQWVIDFLLEPAMLGQLLRCIGSSPVPGGTGKGELAALDMGLDRAERARESLMAVLEQGLLQPGEAGAALERNRVRLNALKLRREELVIFAEREGREAEAVQADRIRLALEKRRAEETCPMEQRLLLRILLSKVVATEEEALLYGRGFHTALSPGALPPAASSHHDVGRSD